ncbi:MAG: AI-2E family transporter [Deltaproteobacteria bacterium]|nr:AI-2E family transporter [Deltaproteobacteria bacterium]
MSDESSKEQSTERPEPSAERGDAESASKEPIEAPPVQIESQRSVEQTQTGRFRRLGEGTFFDWLRRTARLWGFLGFILIVLIVFRAVVMPFILAVLVAYVLSPILNSIARLRIGGRQLPRFVWVIALYLALFGLLGLFFTSFVPRVSKDLKRIVGEAPAFFNKVRSDWVPGVATWLQENFDPATDGQKAGASSQPTVAQPPASAAQPAPPAKRLRLVRGKDGSLTLDARGVELEVVQKGEGRWLIRPWSEPADAVHIPALETRIRRHVAELVQSSERGARQLVRLGQLAVAGLLKAITTFILVFMISAFLLLDTGRILGMMRGLVDRRFRHDFDNVIVLIDKGLSGAIRGQLLICVVNGVLTWIGLKLFGVNYSFLMALLAGIMSLIPIFGSILSSVPIVLVALASSHTGVDLWRGGAMLAWIILIHLIEANLLNPKIIGVAAKIHPVIVIFSVVAGERTYGPIGALLAVPLVSAVQAVFLYVRRKVRAQDETSLPERRSTS